jgi:hypothetical protein
MRQDPQPCEACVIIPLILTFQQAGTITIQVPVTAPGTPDGQHAIRQLRPVE